MIETFSQNVSKKTFPKLKLASENSIYARSQLRSHYFKR